MNCQKIYSLSEIVKLEVLRPSFTLIVKNETTVLHNELTPTVVRKIRTEAQARQNRDNNSIVNGLFTADDCMAVCHIAKEIVVTFTDIFVKVRRFGKNNEHVEVNFTDRKSRFEMLKYTGKLRGSKTSSEVFLNPDYTKAEKQQQFDL